jgi:hypothetical protein
MPLVVLICIYCLANLFLLDFSWRKEIQWVYSFWSSPSHILFSSNCGMNCKVRHKFMQLLSLMIFPCWSIEKHTDLELISEKSVGFRWGDSSRLGCVRTCCESSGFESDVRAAQFERSWEGFYLASDVNVQSKPGICKALVDILISMQVYWGRAGVIACDRGCIHWRTPTCGDLFTKINGIISFVFSLCSSTGGLHALWPPTTELE